jgi:hypothetical protein
MQTSVERMIRRQLEVSTLRENLSILYDDLSQSIGLSCDQIVTVMKRERSTGHRHVIRNVPVSLTRAEALEHFKSSR